DIRADIYGLGATLFWCLTNQTPFAFLGKRARDLSIRLTAQPQGPKTLKSDVSAELDAVVLKMLSVKPEGRHATPTELMKAREPFIPPGSEVLQLASMPAAPIAPPPSSKPSINLPLDKPATPHVLIIDKDDAARTACRQAVQAEGFSCAEAASGKDAAE